MRKEASLQRRSVFEMASVMALSAVGGVPERARRLSLSAMVAARKSGSLLSGVLLEHYRTTLTDIHRTGYMRYSSRQLKPYLRAAFQVFSPKEDTLTERFVRRKPDA
jgi:hypothetical protein